MVAVVVGNGLGLFNTSANILGSAGMHGQSVLGQAAGRSIVNAATGNLVLQMLDEQLSGRGLDLNHLRTYNSLGALTDGDGDGWRWGYEQTVRFQGPGTPALPQTNATVIRTDGDGHETTYTWNASLQRYVSTEGSGAHDYLTYDGAQQEWVWTDGTTRIVERYSNSTSATMTGRLVRRIDTSGNSLTFAYDGSGRLTLVKDTASQQELALTYAAFGSFTRLQKVETRALANDGTLGGLVKQVEYGYTNGRLTMVKTDLTPGNTADDGDATKSYVTNYTYNAAGRVESMTQSDGTSVFFTYHADGKVATVKDSSGASANQLAFTYGASQTTITDGNAQVWTYKYDPATQQLTEILTPAVNGAPLSTKFEYDASGNVSRVTDARNNQVTYGYDANGNRTLERDALGNTVTRTFNALNQVVTETRYTTPDADLGGPGLPSGALTTRYIYDSSSRLRYVVSAEGRVSETRYGTSGTAAGLATHTLRYTAAFYDVSALGETAVLTEAQLNAWVAALADKTKVQITQVEYDLRGNVSKQTSYATVNTSGAGVLDAAATVTEHVYDAHGSLLQLIAVRGAARDQRATQTSLVYDGMGRVLSSTSSAGTQTTVYDAANRRIQVTRASGLVETRSYDTRGRLISVSQVGDGATRLTKYVYDTADRLRMVEDAQGGRRFSFYDAAGRLTFTVDATGAVARFEYNNTGQLTTQTQFATRITPAAMAGWYNAGNDTVTKLTLTVGTTGTDVLTNATLDRTTTSTYDAAGRLATTTDAANTVTTATYDGASRVTLTQTGDRTTRNLYDKDGRNVGVIDALGFLTEFKYDAAGRLIETIRYSERSPAAVNRTAPVWIGVTNQTATGGRLFEYRVPAFDADGDGLTYSVVGTLPSWLTLDASSGTPLLRGTPPKTLTSYTVTLRADDGRGRTSDVSIVIAVTNSAPTWGQLPDSTVQSNTANYTLTLPAASDNESTAAQLTYSLLSSLPAGLAFDAAQRKLSGTPTVAGVYVLTARVTDHNGLFVDRTFTLTVTNKGPTWPPISVPQLRQGQLFTMTVPAAIDPEGQTLTYGHVTLPGWLSFNPSTRVLSGTPPQPGREPVMLRVRDPEGLETTLSFDLFIAINNPPTWAPLPPMVMFGGSPADHQPPAAVDPEGEPLSYSAVSGLPAGLSVNSATGRIQGTTTVIGIHTVTLRATDAGGAFVERTLSIDVRNAVPVYHGGLGDQTFQSEHWMNWPTPPPPWFGRVEWTIPAGSFTDGNGDPLTFTASGMPGWLNFNASTRTFSGTVPGFLTHVQSSVITVTAHDGRGGVASATFTVRVLPDVGDQIVNPGDGNAVVIDPDEGAPAEPDTDVVALVADPLVDWRPASAGALRSHVFYDGQGRVVGMVDERQFLTEIVYDDALNTQRTLRYQTAVTVGAGDTLAALKGRAGTAQQTVLVEYDQFGRVSQTTAHDGTTRTRNEYDSAGRLVRVISADGTNEQRAVRTRYNAFGEVTGALGGVGEATLPANPTATQIDAAIAARGVRSVYDSLGRVIRTIDAHGNTTLFYYDREGRLSHTVRVVGQAGNNTLAGEVSETVYNAFGQADSLRRYATRFSNATMQQLLANGGGGFADQTFLSSVAALANDALDQRTAFEYDRRGLVSKQTDGEGGVTTNSYTAHGQLATQIRSILQGRTTTTRFDYDLRGALLSRTGDVGGINFNTRMIYDAFGRVVQSIDGAGKATTTSYQDSGRTIVVTDPLDRAVRTEYDAFSRVLKVIDALGQQTQYAYDAAQRSMTVTTPESVQVTTRRTRHGETLDVRDGRGNVTAYDYNKDGQLIRVTDALGRPVTTNEYDNGGRLFKTTDARGGVVELSYDQLNRVIERRVDPTGLNLRTTYEFNALGQNFKVTEAAGTGAARVTTHEFDRRGQLKKSVVDPAGLQLMTRYAYDDLGNVLRVERGTVSSPTQQVTLYEFDNLGRRVKEIATPAADFGAGAPGSRDITTEYRYDTAGRVSRRIDALGQSTWYLYDAAGQQTHVVNDLGEVSESKYDANGRTIHTRRYFNRLSATIVAGFGDVATFTPPAVNANDQRTFTAYDNDGRVRFVIHADIDTTWYIRENRYDANGNVIETRRYEKGLLEARINAIDTATSPGITVAEIQEELVTLGYSDSESTLTKIQRTRFAYDATNRLRFTVDALGSVSESVYDAGGLVVSTVRYATRPTLSAYTESVIDAAVNRADVNNQATHIAYDAAGRVVYNVRVLVPGASGQHLVSKVEYDALGQVTKRTDFATAIGLTAFTKQAIDGAVVADAAQDRTTASVYDAAGRQVYSVRVLSANQHVVSKVEYDALGQAVKTIAYAKLMALADFNRATLDAATAAAGNLSPQDRVTSFVYDAAGRQRFVIGANGALGEIVYDALGQVRERRRLDLFVPTATAHTEAALSALRGSRAVGDGVTRGERYTYDRAGRLLTTTDAKGETETNTYNGLGNRDTYTNKLGATWSYFYDRVGRVFRELSPPVKFQLSGETAPPATDRRLETRFYHDAFGLLAKKVENINTTDARTTDFAYDRVGRLIVTVLPGWYDPATGRVESAHATGRFRREITITYDALGNAVRTRTRTGAATFQHEYKTFDALGRVVHDVGPSNTVVAFTYTTFGEQKEVTRHGVTITGNPANDSHWTVAELANRVSGDSAARMIKSEYDTLGRKTKVTYPTAQNRYSSSETPTPTSDFGPAYTGTSSAAVTQFEYNTFNEVHRERVKISDSSWRETWHYHDVMGREVRTIQEIGAPGSGFHTARTYDALGNVKQVIEYANVAAAGTSGSFTIPGTPADSSDDRITGFKYDALNQKIAIERYGLRFADAAGNMVQKGRLEAVTVQSMTYDKVGRLQTNSDALGNTTTLEYNALGQLTKTTEPARSTAATAAVDPFLNRVTASPVTTLTLDSFGNVLKSERNPGGGSGEILVTLQSYDHHGNLIGSTDANGNTRQRQVDYAGRVLTETQAINVSMPGWISNTHTLERRYAYDASGRQVAVLDVYMDGTTEMQSGQRVVYNAFGDVIEEQRVWGTKATALNALNKARLATYTYDNAGQRTSRTGSDGLTKYFYDLTGQLTRQEQRGDNSNADGTGARITRIVYDRLGRAVLQILPGFDAAFESGDQMTTAFVNAFTQQTYDRWGNVLSRTRGGYVDHEDGAIITDNASTTTYAYNHDNLAIAEVMPATSATRANGATYSARVTHEIRYDLMGRAVRERDVVDDLGTAHNEALELRNRRKEYDALGQLSAEVDATGIRTEYVYDAHGNRVGKKNAIGTVFVDTFDKNGNVVSQGVLRLANGQPYLHGNGTPVLRTLKLHQYDQANRRVGSADVMDSAGSTVHWSFTKLDERNLVRAQRNASGIATTFEYDQFGNKVSEADALGNTQTWSYSSADDFTVGRLTGSVAGTKTTGYHYNDFGQVRLEDYAGNIDQRTYAYHANGLLKRIDDRFEIGTAGAAGGTDYFSTTDVTQYDYTVKGELASERFTRSGSQDVLVDDPEPGVPDRIEVHSLPGITRTMFTRYDQLGRMSRVWAPDALNSGNTLHTLDYKYDELGNVRNIFARYTPVGTSLVQESNKWFTYDGEGRMTIADGSLVNNEITTRLSGTAIGYDALGRRWTTQEYQGALSRPGNPADEPGVSYEWKEYRKERYEYDDLGYVSTIRQQLVRTEGKRRHNGNQTPFFPGDSPEYLAETRINDVRGQVVSRTVYNNVATSSAAHPDNLFETSVVAQTTTASNYFADGRLDHETRTDHLNAQRSSFVDYTYDGAGRVQSYFHRVGGPFDPANQIIDTFTYTYGMQFGGLKETSISVTRQGGDPNTRPGNTSNVYDARGRLAKVVIRNPQEATTRSFGYDTEGRIVTVDEQVRSSSPVRFGNQELFFANGRQVGTLGSGTLAAARFSFAFTPVSEVNVNPTSYTVRTGDTLASIAKSVYGDSALWYLIADANSVATGPDQALPPTEVGRSYRIPSVAVSHNNASTFKPYSAADVIGNTTPSPGLPVPPEQCTGVGRVLASVLVVAISITVSTVVTLGASYFLGPVLGGGLGAGAGNLAGQAAGWALGLQDEIKWKQVGLAAAQGAVGGGIGAIAKGSDAALRLFRAGANFVTGELISSAVNNFTGERPQGPGAGPFELGLSLAGAAWGHHLDSKNFKWSGAASQIANAGLNPQTGWLFDDRSREWSNMASQAARAFTGVVVSGGLNHAITQLMAPPKRTSLRGPDGRFRDNLVADTRNVIDGQVYVLKDETIHVRDPAAIRRHDIGPDAQVWLGDVDAAREAAVRHLPLDYTSAGFYADYIPWDGDTTPYTPEYYHADYDEWRMAFPDAVPIVRKVSIDGMPVRSEMGVYQIGKDPKIDALVSEGGVARPDAVIIERPNLKTPLQMRTEQGVAEASTPKSFTARYNWQNYTSRGLPIPRDMASQARMAEAYVQEHLTLGVEVERNLRLTQGYAFLGQSLVAMELGVGLGLVTGAAAWANPLLFLESAAVGIGADKLVTHVTGSETLGTIAGLGAGMLAGLGRLPGATVAGLLAEQRAARAAPYLATEVSEGVMLLGARHPEVVGLGSVRRADVAGALATTTASDSTALVLSRTPITAPWRALPAPAPGAPMVEFGSGWRRPIPLMGEKHVPPGTGVPAQGIAAPPQGTSKADWLAYNESMLPEAGRRIESVGGERIFYVGPPMSNGGVNVTAARFTPRGVMFDTQTHVGMVNIAANEWLARNPGRNLLVGTSAHGGTTGGGFGFGSGLPSGRLIPHPPFMAEDLRTLTPQGFPMGSGQRPLTLDPNRAQVVDFTAQPGQTTIVNALQANHASLAADGVAFAQCYSTFTNFIQGKVP